jgi:hypothetical protein
VYTRFRNVAGPLRALVSEIERRTATSSTNAAGGAGASGGLAASGSSSSSNLLLSDGTAAEHGGKGGGKSGGGGSTSITAAGGVPHRVLLDRCFAAYFEQRFGLLREPLAERLGALASAGDLHELVRSGVSLLNQTAASEFALLASFFSTAHEHRGLDSLGDAMGELWYAEVRSMVIQVNDLEDLCDLAALVKAEILAELLARPGASADHPLPQIVAHVLQDIQERVIFRAQTYLMDEICGFEPAPEDLDYPGRLLRAVAGSSSGGSGGGGGGGDGDVVVQPPPPAGVNGADASVTALTAGWFPALERTLNALSRLYLAVDGPVFDGLAEEAVYHCAQSLLAASRAIEAAGPGKAVGGSSAGKGAAVPGLGPGGPRVHALLFLVKHLLILREQISPFAASFKSTSTALDFSHWGGGWLWGGAAAGGRLSDFFFFFFSGGFYVIYNTFR